MTRAITVVHDAGDFQLASFRDRDGNPMTVNETEARIERIADGLRQCSRVRWTQAGDAVDRVAPVIAEIHAADYLAFLSAHSGHVGATLDSRYAAPGVLPDTPVTPGAYAAALRACASAMAAAEVLGAGERYAYALCRPPGHHAGRAFMGGYCYLNNAVVAARVLHRAGMRVGVVDVDYHHGNGTADALLHLPDVPFVSLHASTLHTFPYVPTAPQSPTHRFADFDAPPSAGEYLDVLDAQLAHLGPIDALVVSLGYDLVAGDPHGGWLMTPEFFGDLAGRFAALQIPICVVQEGGYALDQLAHCARFFAEGLT